MKAQTFTGYVEHVFPPTQYDAEIAVRNYQDETCIEAMKKEREFPVTLKFTASVKNGCAEQLEKIDVGDKVVVQFYIYGSSGTSKSTGNYYCINKLSIAKKDGITLIEKHSKKDSDDSTEPVVDDIPF